MTRLGAFGDAQPGRRAAAGDAQARHESFERYLTLARRLALRYRWSGEPPDDMIQVASLALLKIVDRWDPEMGTRCPRTPCRRSSAICAITPGDATWIVRPPRGLLDLSLLVESERKKLGAALGREPTVAEFAERLGRPHETVSAAVHHDLRQR